MADFLPTEGAPSASAPIGLLVKPPFEQQIPIIKEQIKRRRHRWRLSYPTFEDVIQDITVHACQQYPAFDPNRGKASHSLEMRFLRWINRLISNQMINMLRNNYSKWQRPCIKCSFNTGDDSCAKTPSRKQCEECKYFKTWKKRKEDQFNVKQTLSIEYHSQEVENQQSDFFDAAEAKTIVEPKLKERLTTLEWRVYCMLYIQHKTEAEVGKALRLKKVGKMHNGYQRILAMKHKFKQLIRIIAEEEGWTR